jgi:hypothetical protein
MRDVIGEANGVDEFRVPGWSCPFCDAENPQSGHEINLPVDQHEIEHRCDYCKKTSVHLR